MHQRPQVSHLRPVVLFRALIRRRCRSDLGAWHEPCDLVLLRPRLKRLRPPYRKDVRSRFAVGAPSSSIGRRPPAERTEVQSWTFLSFRPSALCNAGGAGGAPRSTPASKLWRIAP